MQRYYFHVLNGHLVPDEIGMDLPSLEAVRAEAIVASGEMLRDLGMKAWAGSEWQMHVTNTSNETVLKLCFSTEPS
jgi:hypothetical protein